MMTMNKEAKLLVCHLFIGNENVLHLRSCRKNRQGCPNLQNFPDLYEIKIDERMTLNVTLTPDLM